MALTFLLPSIHAALCAHAACHQLGEYYEGMEKNGAKAADMYEETCFKHGYAESCLSLGNIYITGNGMFAEVECTRMVNRG